MYSTIQNKILDLCVRILIPIILMIGFYILFHGEISAGGGFQAGIIFSIPIIIYILLYGNKTHQGHFFLESRFFELLSYIGVLMYILVGIIGMISNDSFLNLTKELIPNTIMEKVYIFIIEIGICMTIFGTMCNIFISMYKVKKN